MVLYPYIISHSQGLILTEVKRHNRELTSIISEVHLLNIMGSQIYCNLITNNYKSTAICDYRTVFKNLPFITAANTILEIPASVVINTG